MKISDFDRTYENLCTKIASLEAEIATSEILKLSKEGEALANNLLEVIDNSERDAEQIIIWNQP